MNNYFPIRNCPLCSKKLLVGDEDTTYTYFCKEIYLLRQRRASEPHYAVNIAEGIWTQSTIIFPYWVISSSATNTSKIYKFEKEIWEPTSQDLLMEIPLISPNDYVAEKLAKKIKNLVIFT